jgi:predicted MPP superfamily phosphohydrolase
VVSDLKEDIAPLSDLKARHGTYYVTGNHEHYWGVNEWIQEFKRMGATVLQNEHQVIRRGDSQIVLGGVNDPSASRFAVGTGPNPSKAFEGSPSGCIRILMAHQPGIYEAANAAGCHLQLSGHTHAGQFFPWSIFVALAHRYYKGLNRHQDLWVYVNRGTGYWGPPIRFGVPSEVTLLKLVRST